MPRQAPFCPQKKEQLERETLIRRGHPPPLRPHLRNLQIEGDQIFKPDKHEIWTRRVSICSNTLYSTWQVPEGRAMYYAVAEGRAVNYVDYWVNASLKLKVGKATVNFIANTLITTRWDSIVDEYKTVAYNVLELWVFNTQNEIHLWFTHSRATALCWQPITEWHHVLRERNNKREWRDATWDGFEVHRPSSKGAKLLLQVIKAIINQGGSGHHSA